MSFDSHPHQIGDKLIISSGIFRKPDGYDCDNKQHRDDFVQNFRLVQLTITEEKVVKGNYYPDKLYYGYLAKGSDGNEYACQWDYFDEVSNAPYNNWTWHILEGIHYQKMEDNGIRFIAPEMEDFFHKHFLNWDFNSSLFNAYAESSGLFHTLLRAYRRYDVEIADALVNRVNSLFPDTKVALCEKPEHKKHGTFYEKDGCWACSANI